MNDKNMAAKRAALRRGRLEQCLHPECDGANESRGLCMRHYSEARRLVLAGRVSWEELVEKGKASFRKPSWFVS